MDKREIIRNVIIQTNEELRSEKKLDSIHLKMKEELKHQKLKNFLNGFAKTTESSMIAVMDTALFKSGKEGYVIDENGIYSGKLMLENSAIGKPISFIAFNELEKVEVDSSNKSHCILTYTNGDTKILIILSTMNILYVF